MTRAVATSPEAVADDEGKPAVEKTLRNSTEGIRKYNEEVDIPYTAWLSRTMCDLRQG